MAKEVKAPKTESKEATSKEATYKVTLPLNVQQRRLRSGIEVPPGPDGYTGPLTAEQLKAVQDDPQLSVNKL